MHVLSVCKLKCEVWAQYVGLFVEMKVHNWLFEKYKCNATEYTIKRLLGDVNQCPGLIKHETLSAIQYLCTLQLPAGDTYCSERTNTWDRLEVFTA